MPHRARRTAGLVALVLAVSSRALGAPCAGAGLITIAADNRSADASVELVVSGTRLSTATACDPTDAGLTTSYAASVTCAGAGPVKCGRIGGLAPGVWVHRIAAQVVGSEVQRQAEQGVVLAGPGVSNLVEWTIFGRSFVVMQATAAALRAELDAARAYTAAEGRPALVRFAESAFPGAEDPKTIALQTSPTCALDTCADGRKTGYCFEGSDVTVDGLDDQGRPGGVVLHVATCNNSLLRLYGSRNRLRGLVLRGTTDPAPAIAVDTVAIAGLASSGNRLEQCTVVGPTLGDAVSVEGDPASPGAVPAPENAIVASEIHGAEDKGVKVAHGGTALVERSCVHDNRNGGVQATLGGTVTAVENVIQQNRGGPAENGLFVGVPEDVSRPNVLATRGNVVRFNGSRGVSVVNAAAATLFADVVSDNYRAGLRVVRALPGTLGTMATVRGSAFTCNYAPGLCLSEARPCREDAECMLGLCTLGSGAAAGVGVALNVPCTDPGCLVPAVDLGVGGEDVGRNAFTLNANPNATTPAGVNVSSALPAGTIVPARGNQWEHCDQPVDPDQPNKCNMDAVASFDVVDPDGTLDLGTPTGPRHGPDPVVTAISPSRPRAGDLVRVYGGAFNAIDGAACHPDGLPADPCSAENPAVAARNAGDVSQGNHVTVTLHGVDHDAPVHQVTPSMLVFEMPVDCDAAGTLTVARGNDVAAPVVVCDPTGCAGRPVGSLCDDDDVCTLGETCQPDGTCGGGPLLDCTGQCLTGGCDPATGCVARPAGWPCEDGDACTTGDQCSAAGAVCVAGTPAFCVGACLTGACDAALGCLPRPATASCDDGNACTGLDHCSGVADTCVGEPVDCDDANPCTTDVCDASAGCAHPPRDDGILCPEDACHPLAACAAGVCDPGPVRSCEDGHACTLDSCDPALGCVRTAPLGLPAVTCHLTELRALVATVSARRLARRLGARLDCAERGLEVADVAPDGSRRRTRHVARARGCLGAFAGRVRETRRLDARQRAALEAEVADTLGAIDRYFGR
jgi:hypothetical protein